MPYRHLSLSSLVVNPANDRHGELENETAAIAQLFASQEQHMRNLARDLVTKGEVFEPPLVFPKDEKFVVADGNRRTTCMKLLASPRRAPTVELQKYFADLKAEWKGEFPEKIECRVESDRDRVDDILFRRHTGVQGGIGQSNWDDRMKNNFVIRTGKSSGLHVADEIEKCLKDANMLPGRKIPRANLNRLLSAEALRNRVGISVKKGKLEFIRSEQETLKALQRIASDLANREITLDDIWDTQTKLEYIDRLDEEGVLPTIGSKPKASAPVPTPPAGTKPIARKPTAWPHLIPNLSYGVTWTAQLQRHHEIWEELQFKLELTEHPNAISVLFRVLIELSVDHYIRHAKLKTIMDGDKLARRAAKVAEDMFTKGLIDKKYLGAVNKLQQHEGLISMDTLNRYVHSPNFIVSPEHLKMIWGTLSDFIVLCLKA
jgi:hypothetical protein